MSLRIAGLIDTLREETHMSKRHRKWYERTLPWVVASVMSWAPTASGATTWIGQTKETMVCPGAGAQKYYDNFTLDMEPGSGFGTLTIAGGGAIDVFTDWTVDGKWGYFAASFQEPNGGPFVFYGWIGGHRMKGWLTGHNYGTGCVLMGRLRAYQQ
jgi:hypothetical protein